MLIFGFDGVLHHGSTFSTNYFLKTQKMEILFLAVESHLILKIEKCCIHSLPCITTEKQQIYHAEAMDVNENLPFPHFLFNHWSPSTGKTEEQQ